ncbi:MAG: efflux RND transporter periplasmic adaptor subunit, partial [Reyranella sp.]|nr:efflux RND transporter periplasmic adaptor subunit [Reyranella sp.]
MKRGLLTKASAVAALAVVIGGAYLFLQHNGRDRTAAAAAAGQVAIPVTVAIAQKQNVPIYVRGIGTVQAFNMAVIRTRVDGEIVKVSFQEGQDVKAGDPLFQIDPRPFQAAFDQAQSNRAQNEAKLVGAQLDLDRYVKTSAKGYEPLQLRDDQRARVDALKGLIAADEAVMQSARLNLIYADIRAPFDGRTGTRQVDVGNLVQASQA